MKYQWRITWQGHSGAIYSDLRMSDLSAIWRGFAEFPKAWKWATFTRIS